MKNIAKNKIKHKKQQHQQKHDVIALSKKSFGLTARVTWTEQTTLKASINVMWGVVMVVKVD